MHGYLSALTLRLHGLIFGWRTFLAVSLLGVIQAVVAGYSGFFAVKGVEDKVRKRHHYWFFGLLSMGLLALTMLVGYLNDGSQQAAEGRAKKAEGEHQDLLGGLIFSIKG